MEYLIAVLLGTVGSLIAWEISLRYRRWCEAIIRSAVRRLPDDQRTIRQEEWLAALNDCIGLTSSFAHAIGCWVGAPAVGASLGRAIPARVKSNRLRTSADNLKSKVGLVVRLSNRLFDGLALIVAGAISLLLIIRLFPEAVRGAGLIFDWAKRLIGF